MSVVRIALDVPRDDLFDYECGEADAPVGALVVVPFGSRRAVGVVTEHSAYSRLPREHLRRIERVLPVAPLPPAVLRLARFCSAYYCAPLGQVLAAAIPTALRRPGYRPRPAGWCYSLTALGRTIDPESLPLRSVAARKLLEALRGAGAMDDGRARAIAPRAEAVLRRWTKNGWVERRPLSTMAAAGLDDSIIGGESPRLTADQERAVRDVSAAFGRYSAWLLQGITGSGKTEVYLQLVAAAASRGFQTLLLVPEINLTPQLEARFRQRFPRIGMVSLHSGLAQGERLARWARAASGEAMLVLGTRLAVFTPLPRLGLILVDEEHDASYKQREGVRYHARDLAVWLAHDRAVPIVLGSATPSLESCFNARKGRFGLLRLRERPAAAQLPRVRLLEIRAASSQEAMPEPVLAALAERLGRREQSLVFINRRGYAPVLLCKACGWAAQCPRCAARLTLHLRARALRCHYCGHREAIAAACPDCGNQELRALGQGTQRLEETLASRFPEARVLRVDSDTTRRRHSFARMREQIHDQSVDLLVGTQMLAKGHDFPKLTLVVVVGADHSLYSADFRAAERLFQQLMQVAGRAGRAELPGEVIVLTRFPGHPLYEALEKHDYDGFADILLAERRRNGFPPYVHQAVLRAEAVREQPVMAFLSRAAREADGLAEAVTVYDPVPAPMPRLAGHYRGQLLVQSHSRAALQRFLGAWRQRLHGSRASAVRWALDVDPLEL
ncbi:MAG TPA: primosomal protein N' [Burkholderiales bacterium]|jgi:primosomal protein N' (replication factor Y)|nr:primosomal protein N' [Burkholderiales bacterium]